MAFLRWLLSGWVLRLLVAAGVLTLAGVQYPTLVRLDDQLFSLAARFRPVAEARSVAVVEIDQVSLQQVGPWPWPRTYLAEGVSSLTASGAAAVALLPPLPAPEWNPGLSGLLSLQKDVAAKKEYRELRPVLAEMLVAIDGDRHLLQAVDAADAVVLPILPADTKTEPIAAVKRQRVDWAAPSRSWQDALAALHNPLEVLLQPAPPAGLVASFKPLAESATAHGYLPQADNSQSRIGLLSPRIGGDHYPSLPLQLARFSLSGSPKLEVTENRIVCGDRIWASGEQFDLLLHPRRAASLPVYSFVDLVAGKVDADRLKGRAVLIGLASDPALSASAAVTEALLTDTQLYRPHWAFLPELAALVFFALFLILFLPRLKLWQGGLLLVFFLLCWGGGVTVLLKLQGVWLQPTPALLLVVLGSLVVLGQRLYRGRMTGYEDLKLLGLSLQGQGMLDMAFDKFRQCPVHDPSVKEILYNLGLDFERKRMFSKAVTVYQHLLKAGKFKDAKQKVAQLQDAEGTVVLGAGGNGKNAGLTLVEGRTAPTLGRYEIVRELGQGAMGTVYLGRDPKINREVAIKTLNIRDIEPQQVAEVKSRFYREAEAAGGLNHPNIVTIYDAGEEHDLAYMAMEFLQGETLAEYCVKEKLLPPAEVLRIAAEIADALAYAHDNDVIHRDIKPANIMLVEGGKVKVTDFGIARVMGSSHTQTGTILGTPSYMSPEQVAGKKVDGRSDQFSLGVVCYELFSGIKPFTGDNIGALMFNISKADYPPLNEVKKRLPQCAYDIVGKLLSKGVTGRYKSACELAEELRSCAARMRKK